MNSEKFIKLDLFKVAELKEGFVFAGKIKFEHLNKICKFTVRSVEEELKNENFEDFLDDETYFQRRTDGKRIKALQEYLFNSMTKNAESNSMSVFPSSVILYNQFSKTESQEDLEFEREAFFVKNPNHMDIWTINIPNHKGVTLIVDGQHRIYATKKLYEKVREGNADLAKKIENLEFIVTYLLGYEINWAAKIFIDVNFKQKPVNRSLYYDIFGSFPPNEDDDEDDNILKLSHDLCVYLNRDKNSPLKSMIKMLGQGDGLISQGFMVDALAKIFSSKSGVWVEYSNDYQKGGRQYLILAEFMSAYFSAVRNRYPSSWPKNLPYTSGSYRNSILCKTTGMGAYLKLIVDVFPLVSNNGDMQGQIEKIFCRISDSEAQKLFDKNGEYGGAGAAGLQSKLYKRLKELYGLAEKSLF